MENEMRAFTNGTETIIAENVEKVIEWIEHEHGYIYHEECDDPWEEIPLDKELTILWYKDE
ncbi:unnamed protein product, partial [marine sediment metagenome]